MDVTVSEATVALSGVLTEHSNMEPVRQACALALRASTNGRAKIDFSRVERANSVGLLSWLKTVHELGIPISYVNAPPWLVEQFNTIEVFFTMDAIVESVQVAFYAVRTNSLIMRTLHIGVDIPVLEDYSTYNVPPQFLDGELLEPDFDPSTMFYFVERFGQSFVQSHGSR